MALTFPASPTTGQTYTYNGDTYTFDGKRWTVPVSLASGGTAAIAALDADPVSPVVGETYYNIVTETLRIWTGDKWGSIVVSPLGSELNPALSGYDLYNQEPSLPNGYYWIKSPSMPNALRMWVDMEYGGYDLYAFEGNGISTNYANQAHSGTPLGLDIVYPRSPNNWRAMSNFVRNATGGSPLAGTYADYFQIIYGVHKTSGGGNYTTTIFRHPDYGSGSSAHRVNDDGRWWVRDVTHSEPNGDYTAYAWFGLQAGGYGFPNPYNGENIFFNDGNANYATGGYYLVSTNAKPD